MTATKEEVNRERRTLLLALAQQVTKHGNVKRANAALWLVEHLDQRAPLERGHVAVLQDWLVDFRNAGARQPTAADPERRKVIRARAGAIESGLREIGIEP